MLAENDFEEIVLPPSPSKTLHADQALSGLRFTPQQQILIYSADAWEELVQEWAYFCLKAKYIKIRRFTGAGDRGIDIAGFTDTAMLSGVWDNYQCKHYDHALRPSDAWVEIGKMLWYSYKGEFAPPRKYYFTAPKGVGTTLSGLISDKDKLRARLIKEWDSSCKDKITKTQEIRLEGEFATYVDGFDFTIFEEMTSLEIIEDHKTCPCHIARFGGGLPDRPDADAPPEDLSNSEMRYVQQLFSAYGDHLKQNIETHGCLSGNIKKHFDRQRVAFYHAESLRIFARDTVPAGTFESFQDDVFHGVVDTSEASHADGYVRVCAVTKAARDMQITSNALITRAKPLDRDGICHQLANEDRLLWTEK